MTALPKHFLPPEVLQALQSHLADIRGETQALLEAVARCEAECPPSFPGPWSGYLAQAVVALDRADQCMQDVVDGGRPATALYAFSALDG